jgi:hypothetical protein
LGFDENGNARCLAPASDANGSVVTTVAHSYGNNGYCKLGNGLIIQWGKGTTPANISLPTSFTSTNYKVTFGASATVNDGNYQNLAVSDKTTSGFNVKMGTGSFATGFDYIAIGY